MKTIAFIDASNLFYGGEKSLGWKIDYQKLIGYLKEKYGIEKALYFGGVEIYDFKFDYLKNETVPIEELVLARGPRAAREIRQFAGSKFRDFTRLESIIRFEENK